MRTPRTLAIAVAALGATVLGAGAAWGAYTDTATINPPPGGSGSVSLATYGCDGTGRMWERIDEAMTFEIGADTCSYVRVRAFYTAAGGGWSGWSSWKKDPVSVTFATSGQMTQSQHSISR